MRSLNPHRIRSLYVKDLLDILRDHRTLLAMVIVPIVLYPLLMIGSLHLASFQSDRMKEEVVRIAVTSEAAGRWLDYILKLDIGLANAPGGEEEGRPERAEVIRQYELHSVPEADIEAHVLNGTCHCGLLLDPANPPPAPWLAPSDPIQVQIVQDSAEVRSALAAGRLAAALDRYSARLRSRLAVERGLPASFVSPLAATDHDVASAVKRGGSMLGQVLPLILILLTMTGAIYPAIDLTAGERERGTLETLMVCPVPVIEIIIGKFLVVTTVALIGATLNLASMGLTVQFGGLGRALSDGGETVLPLSTLPVILLFLIPLAVLFSAVLLAVCSFARNFKEAQNYVMPVMLAVLVPAGIAALPGTELEGVMQVLPVANVVLLTREMLLGNHDLGAIIAVLVSTSLYAAAAVAVAVRVFGQEAVLFADAISWRAQFDRTLIQPAPRPSSTLALMYVAVLFPLWFFTQTGIQQGETDLLWMLGITQVFMVLFFAVLPVLLVMYFRIDPRSAFNLRWPSPRFWLSAVLIGAGSWAVANELMVFQYARSWFGLNDQALERLSGAARLGDLDWLPALLLLAMIPAACEELLFRGLLLSGIGRMISKWGVLLSVGLIFAVYHYIIQRFVVTFALGVLLAYICWQSRSILPGMVVHALHNAITVLGAGPLREPFARALHIDLSDQPVSSLPVHVTLPAAAAVVAGILLCRGPAGTVRSSPAGSPPR